MRDWYSEDILVTVRAYPEPSSKHIETSCVAGVTLRGDPIRLFPIRDRDLQDNQKFSKYTIIRARIKKAPDPRPESHYVDVDSIQVIRKVSTESNWSERNDLIVPLRHSRSVEDLEQRWKDGGQKSANAPSLALIRPKDVDGIEVVAKQKRDWDQDERAKLTRQDLFSRVGKQPLEYIPYWFRYRFSCDDLRCQGHVMSVLDWEANQAYRSWRLKYGEQGRREALEKKFSHELINKKDLQIFVGTLSNRPWQWTIVGLYYPAK